MRKTTVNIDAEFEAALAELLPVDGSQTDAMKRSVIDRAKRLRRNTALLEWIAEYEAEQPIPQEYLDEADAMLDRQGVPR